MNNKQKQLKKAYKRLINMDMSNLYEVDFDGNVIKPIEHNYLKNNNEIYSEMDEHKLWNY